MPFIVNSSPGAGLRYEAGATFIDAKSALGHAAGLALRGMRLIKIKDTVSGEVFDERALRHHIQQAAATPREAPE